MPDMMGKPKTPEAPAVPEPIRVPNETDPDILVAKRKKMDEIRETRQGRASTDLTTGSSQPYTRTALG